MRPNNLTFVCRRHARLQDCNVTTGGTNQINFGNDSSR